MIQEGHDQRRVDLLKIQLRRRLVQSLLGELQELAKGITIGADGVRTRLPLLHQALSKKTFQQCRETDGGVHD